MRKLLIAFLALSFLAFPLPAEAQQKKKKKQQDDDNPIVLLLGIFSTVNCILTCAGTTSAATQIVTSTATVSTTTLQTVSTTIMQTVTTTTFVQELEQFITVTQQVPVTVTQQVPVTTTNTVTTNTARTVLTKKILNAYVTGAVICTFTWPFINFALGGPEPTSEEAVLNTVSCWVPGLGILLHLQKQQGA